MSKTINLLNEGFEKRYGVETSSPKKVVETKFQESLKRVLSRLNEKEMSPEDKKDSELLRGIYSKTLSRANAKLSPEEQAVLDKYGLKRTAYNRGNGNGNDVKIYDDNTNAGYDRPVVSSKDSKSRYISGRTDKNGVYHSGRSVSNDTRKINYADRARKNPERIARDTYTATGNWGGFDSTYINPRHKEGEHDRYRSPRRWEDHEVAPRYAQQAGEMQSNYNKMAKLVGDRNRYQKDLDTAKSTLDKRLNDISTEYEKKIADARKHRDWDTEWAYDTYDSSSNPEKRDNAQKEINKLLKRESLKKKKEIK